jgi:hypothetical protein
VKLTGVVNRRADREPAALAGRHEEDEGIDFGHERRNSCDASKQGA